MVEIRIEKPKNLNIKTESAFVKFPYKEEWVNQIRTFVQRTWHPQTKEWEVPVIDIPQLLNIFEGHQIRIFGQNKEYATTIKKFIDKREIPELNLKTKLMKHQLDAVDRMINDNRVIIGDQAGTGKSLSAIASALARKELDGFKHTLIICGVNILKWNWVNEIKIHTYEEGYILGQRTNKNNTVTIGSSQDKLYDLDHLPENYFLITNIESLRHEEIAKKIKSLCEKKEINYVILDEGHVCCSPSAKQTKGWMSLEPECRAILTATVFMNKPLDLWAPLNWLKVDNHSFYQFKNHYAVMGGYGGYEVVSYRFLEDLQKMLSDVQLRRLKKDILDLPEIIVTNEYLDMEPDQASLYNEVHKEIMTNIDKVKLSPNPLVEMLRLRQVTSNPAIITSKNISCAKFERLDAILEERIPNEKVVVVSNWTGVTDELIKRYAKYNPAVITGQMKEEDKFPEAEKLNNDPNCHLLIGTIKSMGTGLNLQGASTMVYMDEPWNYAVKDEQCSQRIHRLTSTHDHIEIITLINKNTIDERVHKIIEDKRDIGTYLVDNTSSKYGQLVDFLMS